MLGAAARHQQGLHAGLRPDGRYGTAHSPSPSFLLLIAMPVVDRSHTHTYHFAFSLLFHCPREIRTYPPSAAPSICMCGRAFLSTFGRQIVCMRAGMRRGRSTRALAFLAVACCCVVYPPRLGRHRHGGVGTASFLRCLFYGAHARPDVNFVIWIMKKMFVSIKICCTARRRVTGAALLSSFISCGLRDGGSESTTA